MKRNIGYKVLSLVREFVSGVFAVGLLVCVCWASMSYAAVLNVDLDVSLRPAETEKNFQKTVAIFVLDRSSSMCWEPVNDKDKLSFENRNEQLVESVKDRILTLSEIAPNTKIVLLPFHSRICKRKEYSLNSQSSVKDALNWPGFRKEECEGDTLLYDSLAYAWDCAFDYLKDPEVKVQIYAYSDGGNYSFGETKNEDAGTRFTVRYETRELGNKEQMDRAYEKYMSDHRSAIEDSINQRRIDGDIIWRWLGAGDPPKGVENNLKDLYPLQFFPNSIKLKSDQTLKANLVIPIPKKNENDLVNKYAIATLKINGKEFHDQIPLTGSKKLTFQIPDGEGGEKFKGKLYITNLPDISDRIELQEPKPLEIEFSAPDKLSISIKPNEDIYAKVGDKINFSAKASDGASVTWNIAGESFDKSDVSFICEKVGNHTATAKAEKKGFLPATPVSVKLHVIDAGVEVRLKTQNPTVGEPIEFEAKPHGKPAAYFWKVDNTSVSGQGKSLTTSIERSGKHTVKVRASYGSVFADSEEFSFNVAVKPRLTIKEPYPDSEFEFGQKIECLANFEGDLDKVIWSIDGPVSVTTEAAVEKEKRIALASFSPTKGGQYTLSAKAIGPAGEIPATTEIPFKVAYEDLGIWIVSPTSGTTIELGSDAKNPVLKASVKGDTIKQVKWTMLNTSTGVESEIRTTDVKNGEATCVCPNDLKIGNGVTLLVQAEAVYDDPGIGEPVISHKLELLTHIPAKLDVQAKINGEWKKGGILSFGEQLELQAECGGCIKPSDVQWFAETDGKERPVVNEKGENAKGSWCMTQKEEANGKDFRVVNYFAKAKLPDGKVKQSGKIPVYYNCVCKGIKVSVGLPKDKNDPGKPVKKFFGLSDDVEAWIVLEKDEKEIEDVRSVLKDIVLDMGDGTKIEDTSVCYRYKEHSTNTVTVTGKCVDCGHVYTASEKVIVKMQKPVASFEVKPPKVYYTVGGKLNLCSTSEGDVANYIWFVDGKVRKEFTGQKEPVFDIPKRPCNIEIQLRVEGVNGADPSESQPYTLKVRYGVIATIIIVIAGFLMISVFAYLLFGNRPCGWRVKCWAGPEPSSDEEEKSWCNSKGKPLIDKCWSLFDKKAKIPVKILSKKEWFLSTKPFVEKCDDNDKIFVESDSLSGYKPALKKSGKIYIARNFELKGENKHYYLFDRRGNDKKDKTLLRFVVIYDDVTHKYEILFVIVCFCILGLMFWAMLKWAIALY